MTIIISAISYNYLANTIYLYLVNKTVMSMIIHNWCGMGIHVRTCGRGGVKGESDKIINNYVKLYLVVGM